MNPPNLIERRVSDGGRGRPAAHAGVVSAVDKASGPGFSLGELAEQFGCTVQGNRGVRVTHVSTLQDADAEAIVFIANAKFFTTVNTAIDTLMTMVQ